MIHVGQCTETSSKLGELPGSDVFIPTSVADGPQEITSPAIILRPDGSPIRPHIWTSRPSKETAVLQPKVQV
jgi:hypothetical protein